MLELTLLVGIVEPITMQLVQIQAPQHAIDRVYILTLVYGELFG